MAIDIIRAIIDVLGIGLVEEIAVVIAEFIARLLG